MNLKRSRSSISPSTSSKNNILDSNSIDPSLENNSSTISSPIRKNIIKSPSIQQPPISTSTLREEDIEKLAFVISSIDTEDVLSYNVGDTSMTIGEAFRTAGTSFNLLRNATKDAVASLPSPSSPPAVNFLRTVLGLLNNLEQKYNNGVLSEESIREPKRFMLHRSLVSVDLFTSADELNEEELAEMNSVEDTDVIAVFPPSASLTSNDTIPTLKSVNPLPKPLRNPPPPTQVAKIVPVSLLYYDPFASFAPTHDSSGANISYTTTNIWRSSKAKMKEWDLEPLEPIASTSTLSTSTSSSSFPSTSTPTSNSKLSLTPIEISTLESLGLDSNEIIKGWETYQNQNQNQSLVIVEEELKLNSERLNLLIKSQWNRLRKGKDKGINQIDELEGKTATELLHSLSSLISSLSNTNTTTNSSSSNHSIVPSPERIEKLLPLIMNSLIRESNFIGSLEILNFRAVKESNLRANRGLKQLEEGGVEQNENGDSNGDVNVNEVEHEGGEKMEE